MRGEEQERTSSVSRGDKVEERKKESERIKGRGEGVRVVQVYIKQYQCNLRFFQLQELVNLAHERYRDRKCGREYI